MSIFATHPVCGYGQVYVLDFDTCGEDGKMRILPITVGLQNRREGEMFSEWQIPKFGAVGATSASISGSTPDNLRRTPSHLHGVSSLRFRIVA